MATQRSNGTVPAAPSVLADGPWWFHGVFLYDGTCEELGEFFEQNMPDLDRATGSAISLSAIGDPKVTGKDYERRRTRETIKRQATAAKNYRRLVAARGNSDHHRRRETQELVEQSGIALADLPCVIFLTSPRYDSPPILKIERRWLWTPELRVALRDSLVQRLAEAQILGFGQSGKTTTAELAGRLIPVVETIREDMAFAEAAEAAKGKAQRPIKSMPVPRGTIWSQVHIEFVDGHTVDVTVPGKRASVTYAQMGLVDRRNGRPDKQWELLEKFANGRGDFGWGVMANRGRLEKRVQELTLKLKQFFRLEDPPFKLHPENRRWRAEFKVHHQD